METWVGDISLGYVRMALTVWLRKLAKKTGYDWLCLAYDPRIVNQRK